MDEINLSNDFYSDMFSLYFNSLSSTVDLERLEMKENRTAPVKSLIPEFLAFCD